MGGVLRGWRVLMVGLVVLRRRLGVVLVSRLRLVVVVVGLLRRRRVRRLRRVVVLRRLRVGHRLRVFRCRVGVVGLFRLGRVVGRVLVGWVVVW